MEATANFRSAESKFSTHRQPTSDSMNSQSKCDAEESFRKTQLETRLFSNGYPSYVKEVHNIRRPLYEEDRRPEAAMSLRLTSSFSTEQPSFELRTTSTALNEDSCPDQLIPVYRCRALKNLLVLSCGCMLWLTAFTSLQNLQSTLNPHRGVGVIALGAMYGVMLMSCFLAPSVIAILGAKWTIVAAYSLFLVVVSANFYPRDFLLVPASVVFGCVAGPLWTAQSAYLTTLSIRYAQTIRELPESTVNRFNGVFVGLMQTSQVWGSLISAMSLSADNDTIHLARRNHTCTQTYCGARDCNPDDFENDHNVPHHAAPLPPNARSWLLSVEATCVVIAILLPLALLDRNIDSRDRDSSEQEDHDVGVEGWTGSRGRLVGGLGGLPTKQLLTATVRMMKDSRLEALAPLVLFVGLQQGFVITDFTKSYINCALGIHQIGFVMLSFGAVNSVTSVAIGHVAKHIKRIYIIASGAVFNAGTLLVLASWGPTQEDEPMFFVVASCLGLCDAIWQTQLNTMFGMLFSECQEAAFSCFRIFQTAGLIISFICSQTICIHSKVYAMSAALVVSLVLYGAVEYSLHRLVHIRDGGMIIVL